MKVLFGLLCSLVLASSLAVGQSMPGPGNLPPPPSDGGQLEPGEGGDFPEEYGDDFEDEFEDEDDASELASAAYDLIYALEDYAYDNCNSKKDKGKFNSATKVVRQLLGKLTRLPGLESEEKDEMKEVKSSAKDLSASLKDLCDPAQKEADDEFDDEEFDDEF